MQTTQRLKRTGYSKRLEDRVIICIVTDGIEDTW